MASPKDPPKRRLPVLNSPSAEADMAETRRPWQWVGFGTLTIFTAWIPLAALAGVAVARLPAADAGQERVAAALAMVGLYAVALALGAGLGGFLVGRWGTAGVGVREAVLAGLGAAVVACAVTWISFGPSPGALLVAAVALPMAALGGRAGVRARARQR
jgi:MFS family permease